MSYLESLAVRFVEPGGLSVEEQDKIIADAADYICSGYRNPPGSSESPALQLARSIQRWHSFTGDDDDDDEMVTEGPGIEKKARAHRFMARTLADLPKKTLKTREVKLFISFFCSMFQLHDANLLATAEALTSLICMDNLEPSAAADILSSIGSMEPDTFTKQLAKVRLAIFNLIASLFHGPPGKFIRDQNKQGDHLLKVLPIFGRERDPFNLLQWFRFLNGILQEITLSTEAADAIFESFSPFFPISIRKSTATGPEVTEEQLKEALNSCFSANGMLAPRTIPFLLGKLDAGASLTAAAKLDILQTVNACVKNYKPADKHVVPYVSQIWSSFKYEVRHGEIPEAIQETLAVFSSVSKCLASESLASDLKSFVDKTWDDCAEDLENPTYTEQAGSIFISIAKAHLRPFHLLCPRVLDAVRRIVSQPKSPTHTKALVAVLNNLLRARRSALPPLPVKDPLDIYHDNSITITRDIYFALWKENAVENPNKEQTDIAKLVLEGLSQVAKQRRPPTDKDATSYISDCDEVVFKEICATLAHRVTNCFIIQIPTSHGDKDIDEAAIEALRTTVSFYPAGYSKIMSDFINDVAKRNWTNNPAERSYEALHACCSRLASIGCLSLADSERMPAQNFLVFVGSMLKVLVLLFEQKSDLKACVFVVNGLAQGVQKFCESQKPGEASCQDTLQWTFHHVDDSIATSGMNLPDLVKGDYSRFDPSELGSNMGADEDWPVFCLIVGIYTVRQLYQHATRATHTTQGVSLDLCQPLVVDSDQAIWRDRYLSQVGNIATTVLSELHTKVQTALILQEQILSCFHFHGQPNGDHVKSWKQHGDDMISELSVGVARAIEPGLVVRLHGQIDDILLGDLDAEADSLTTAARNGRENVALLIANKYDTRAKATAHIEDHNNDVWVRVLTEIRETLSDANTMATLEGTKFRRIVSILIGAMTRGDRFIDKDLVEATSHAAVKSGPQKGRHIARFLSKVFAEPTDLGPLIKNPIHRQRTYHQCVHPVIGNAYPLQPEQDDSVIYAVFVLHAVKQLTLDQYEGDADRIVRIALAAMQKATHVQDIDAACSILLSILRREPSLLQDHVSSIVAATQHVYLRATAGPTTTKSIAPEEEEEEMDTDSNSNPWGQPENNAAAGRLTVRKRCIRILRVLPQQMDGRFVRRDANGVLAFLLEVLADRAREVRHLAQTARNAWLSAAE